MHYFFAGTPFAPTILSFSGKLLVSWFLVTAYIGHFGLMAFASLGIILVPLIFILPKPKFIIPIAIITATILILFIFIDTFVYNQYTFHLNGIILQMFFGGAGGEVFDFTWLEYTIITIVIALIVVIETTFAVWLWRFLNNNSPRLSIKWPIYILLTCLLMSYYIAVLRQHEMIFRPIRDAARPLPYYNNVLALLLSKHSLTKLQTYGQNYIVQPDQAIAKLHYPIKPLVCTPAEKPMNLLVIVVDTWRYDLLTAQATPFIYQFSKQASVYTEHFSGGNATRPGIFSLFYGVPSTYWTSMEKQGQGPMLIDQLLKQHYQFGVFVSAGLKMPAFNRTVFLQVKNLQLVTPGKNPEIRDQSITQEFSKFITQTRQKQLPFFSFLFYDAAHSYCAVPDALKPFQPAVAVCNRLQLSNYSNPTPYVNRYKNALLLVDEQVKQAITLLKQNNLLNNTVIVITGDHGQEFNDNHLGYWGHASNFTHYQVKHH